MKEKLRAACIKIWQKINFAPHIHLQGRAACVIKESFLVHLRSGTTELLQTTFVAFRGSDHSHSLHHESVIMGHLI